MKNGNQFAVAALSFAGLCWAAMTTASFAQSSLPKGTNTIEGTVGEGPAGAAICAKATVYLYEALPDLSPADGGARTPIFEKPAPSDEHWETPCMASFSFKDIPDGSYLVGVPSPGGAPALATLITESGGKTTPVVLTFQQPER